MKLHALPDSVIGPDGVLYQIRIVDPKAAERAAIAMAKAEPPQTLAGTTVTHARVPR